MKASRPDISAPLSRARKKDGDVNIALLVVVVGTVFLALFFIFGLIIHKTPATSVAGGHSTTGDAAIKSESRLGSSNKERTIKTTEKTFLTLITKHGNIHIRLLPDLSPESVEYIQNLFRQKQTEDEPCQKCQFYRSEPHFLLQGILQGSHNVKLPSKGPCPAAYLNRQQDCPPHDPSCGCHGPTMTKGMVAWAGGGNGPDFFVNTYDEPVEWWGQQHTVWGIVEAPADLEWMEDKLLTMPVKNRGGMNMLEEPFEFKIHFKETVESS